MAMKLLPQHPTDETDAEARDSAEDSRRDHNPEEIPEAANERPAVELGREKSPRKRRRADEPGEKSDVRGEVFYRRAAKLIELGKNL